MRAEWKRLAYFHAKKWHREYSDMVGLVHLKMYLEVLRSNNLLLKGHQANKGLLERRIIW